MSLDTFARSLADLLDPPPPRWATPGALATALDPTVRQTPALELIDRNLVDAASGRCERLIISMAPQEGKSQRTSRWFPLWVLAQNPDTRVAIASYEMGVARRWGRAIRNDIATHGTELGLSVASDSAAAHEWQLDGHLGGCYAVGVGGALTGRPVDLLVIDDPIKDAKQANSPTYRENVWDWWTSVGRTRLAPGAPVVLILTRWHEDDLAGRLLSRDGEPWRVVSIPAQAEGADDPLGRKPGEFMQSARGRTVDQWRRIRREVGSYVWASLYQQHPSPAEGGLFKRLWWRRWQQAGPGRFLVHGQTVDLRDCWRFATVDLAASTRTSADWTVACAWALTLTGDLILLDMARAHVDERRHFDLVRPLAEAYQLDTTFVERSQFGTTLASDATREGVHLTPLTADVDKLTRALPASARAEGGRMWLPPNGHADWVKDLIDEAAAFPNGRHDDIVDCIAYAVRVAITKPAPAKRLEPVRRAAGEVDLMTRPM